MGAAARVAARTLALAPAAQRTQALHALAAALRTQHSPVLAANAADLAAAHSAGISAPLAERLLLNAQRLNAMAADVAAVAAAPDPIGEKFDERTLANGLQVHRQRVPLGVLGVVYESRPNVTIDVAALCLRTGNAAILRGGSEALRSNLALGALVRNALAAAGVPADAFQLVESTDRAQLLELLQLHDHLDLLIPRGGNALHQFCREHSRVPVITGGVGVCHLYVDASANQAAALDVIYNAKVQRPSVCNALDTLLVDAALAPALLPAVVARLGAAGVAFRADAAALAVLAGNPAVSAATAADFDTEWLALVLGLKVVSGLDEALAHIAQHSTAHSDGILTQTEAHAARFVAEVDSAGVFVNASTRFNDGGQLGLGGETAVSTQRLHVRGPMGISELTTYKWVVRGNYAVRA
ncbi:MAG: glutamate-5-semialdehyde dehydrogenase [Chloroflexi bacterium]|nr:glutamate-5-semialdehyde dehydrogenase [Chloroflexota bacterium]